ncbi:MAG: DUF4381 family protein [Desulfocapsa sp.]|nr:DUF4381 family protein [Desulfocapsa sp.]
MKIIHFLILFFVLHSLGFPSLLAADTTQPPLQPAPGSGIQPGTGQTAPQAPFPSPGLGNISAGEQEQLRDIHPPMLLPAEKNYTMIGAGLLLLLLVLALLFWFFRRRKKKSVLPQAHETALADLLQLRSLMTPEQALLYAKELSDVLRRYIEQRFRIRASRKTTKEFFAGLTENPEQTVLLVEDHGDSLKTCLDRCDLAKFARCTPDLRGMEKMEAAVQEFIEATRENREGSK